METAVFDLRSHEDCQLRSIESLDRDFFVETVGPLWDVEANTSYEFGLVDPMVDPDIFRA